MNYLDIIYYGYKNDKDYLDEYFYRKCKEAETEHITQVEFFKRLVTATEELENLINDEYFFAMERRDRIVELWEKSGKDIKVLRRQEPKKENVSINLLHMTNGHYRYKLYFNDVNYIQQSIINAISKYQNEQEAIKSVKAPPSLKKILTYNWLGKPHKLTDFHKSMKGVFIDKETSVKDFCKIFEGVNQKK